MEGRSTAAQQPPKHLYHSSSWSRLPSVSISSSPATPRQIITPILPESPSAHPITPLELPQFFLVPQHTSLFKAQLEQYNKLVSPGRGGGGGGGGTGLQSAPLHPVLSTPYIQAAPRSRSLSKVSKEKNPKSVSQNCHANKISQSNTDKTERAVIIGKESQSLSKPSVSVQPVEMSHTLPSKPPNPTRIQSAVAGQSSSVPSTPLQHARDSRDHFATGDRGFNLSASRDHSPSNHSPRSAFSETISSQKPSTSVPGCQYESPPQGLGRRRMPYSIGNEKLPQLELGKVKSKLSDDEEKRLTAAIKSQYESLLPTAPIEEKRTKLVQKLESVFNEQWPGHNIEVHLFGSSANLLCSDDSDVDICITTEWKDLNVCMISKLLGSKGMEKVVCIRSAKVPIVKIWDPELQLACDMNINNTLALENTRMVRTYVEIDPRVRPLIMVMKYWTKMRVINEAGVGGTFSSYTWICLMISFLQLRKPPVLPALHQRQHQKLPTKGGKTSAFADDLNSLRGFGARNKESLGELLFGFFRFYAHDFDYDKFALSIRLGKMVTKEEKRWLTSLNNRLAVEEPFNIDRNLGNTADDYSFRGVHMEIRKAFDAVSEGDLGKILEKYEFPKEEAAGDRSFFQRPDKPRPVLVRSASQTHGGRGRGGYRGRGNYRNNSSRRASSSVAYDNQTQQQQFSSPVPSLNPQHLMYANQAAASGPQQFYHDLLNTAMAMRMIDYQSQAAYIAQLQAWTAQQQQQQQRQQQQQGPRSTADRSRAGSFDNFDNPPLSAPLRPDLYPFPVPQQPYAAPPTQTGHTTHPSSPSASSATPTEYRRSLHRTAALAESGNQANIRSQSQPASRSHPNTAYPNPTSQPMNLGPSYLTPRSHHGIPINFMPEEAGDMDMEEIKSTSPSDDGKNRYLGSQLHSHSPRGQSTNGLLPTFGDVSQLGQGPRRLSAEPNPQTILDRRMKRTSRSPSPLGHARAFSVGTNSAPLTSAPFPSTTVAKSQLRESSPLVVNGSSIRATSSASTSRLPFNPEALATSDSAFDNPLCISQMQSPQTQSPVPVSTPPQQTSEVPLPDRPLVVNGTTPPTSIHQNHNPMPTYVSSIPMLPFMGMHYPLASGDIMNGSPRGMQTNRQRVLPRQHVGNGMVAHLDLAISDQGGIQGDIQSQQHLSPVYEARSPSPKISRKFEALANGSVSSPSRISSAGGRGGSQKIGTEHQSRKQDHNLYSSGPRANGSHAKDNNGSLGRGGRNDNDGHTSGGHWQKAKPRRRNADNKHQAHAAIQGERRPENEDERKGG